MVSPCLIINSFRQSFSAARLLQFGLVFTSRMLFSVFIFKIITSVSLFFGKNLVKKIVRKEQYCDMQAPSSLMQASWEFH